MADLQKQESFWADPQKQKKFWTSLLAYIKAGAVVPVIGPEFVTVREGDRDLPLYRWLAQRLATDLDLPTAELPGDFDLNDVVSMHLRRGDHREDLYLQINEILGKAVLAPPEPLAALAGIPGFSLFVSLTFDSLLADAIGSAPVRGGRRVEQIAYAPNAVQDLPWPKAKLTQPVVYHLLGRATVLPNYVICDEDLLEFVHGLQDKQRQPRNLFDALHDNHLLILGCSFEDWPARFFLRTARSLALSQNRRCWDVLVGDPRDARLALFLESFSPDDARVIPLPAAQFVAELAARWQAANPAVQTADSAVEVSPGAIFVSYAIEDLEAAGRLATGLRSAGLEVWFDKREIEWGEDWNRCIRRGIQECALFLPVISRQSLNDPRSYYWREWNDAADFAHGMAPDEVFIIPVAIDDTRMDQASLPDAFRKAQSQSLPDGNVTPDVVERLRALLDAYQLRQRGVRA